MYVTFCSENLKAREELISRALKSIRSALNGDDDLLSSSSLELSVHSANGTLYIATQT